MQRQAHVEAKIGVAVQKRGRLLGLAGKEECADLTAQHKWFILDEVECTLLNTETVVLLTDRKWLPSPAWTGGRHAGVGEGAGPGAFAVSVNAEAGFQNRGVRQTRKTRCSERVAVVQRAFTDKRVGNGDGEERRRWRA